MAQIVKQSQPAQSNRKQPDPVTVIGQQFCVPYEVDLTCTRSKPRVTDRSYEITDVDGTLIFKMLVKNMSFSHKRTLLGADGNPIVTIMRKNKKVPDFRVKGSWSQPSMIYEGTSSTILAQTHKDEEFQSIFSGKDKFVATLRSNIDYAFAVILFLILVM
ncbi:hypothetical protein ACFE04_003427 [Oxalis oulophora]